MHTVRLILLGLFTAILVGCATPRYQTAYRYEPPADAAGRSCLTLCERNLNACQDACAADHTACVKTIEPEARANYDEARVYYAGELAQYRRDVTQYHLSVSLGWGHHDGWYGAGWYDPWWPYGGYGPYYYPPEPPRAPSYAEELARLRAAKCDRDCGCQPNFDACFLRCGGVKIPEQRCIANCPPGP